jgi:hypothetical protein
MTITTTTPIGQLKGKVTVYCSFCGGSHRRSLKVNIYENTQEAIEKAKSELTEKGNKKYTCRVCKSILKDIEDEN